MAAMLSQPRPAPDAPPALPALVTLVEQAVTEVAGLSDDALCEAAGRLARAAHALRCEIDARITAANPDPAERWGDR